MKATIISIGSCIRSWWCSQETPDPWPAELDAAVRSPDAVPVCHRCMKPCDRAVWFCPECGAAIGPFNNSMPYLQLFSIGEALRSGVGPEAHFSAFRTLAYLSIGLVQYTLFAPLYFIRLYRNYKRLQAAGSDDLDDSSDGQKCG